MPSSTGEIPVIKVEYSSIEALVVERIETGEWFVKQVVNGRVVHEEKITSQRLMDVLAELIRLLTGYRKYLVPKPIPRLGMKVKRYIRN